LSSASPPSALSSTLAPAYDGNGNITAYLDLAKGQVTSRQDYDAFGKLVWSELSNTVGARDRIPFGFSTKYEDIETGLLYYGYRYYSPELGRWLNRDPLSDQIFLKKRMKEVLQPIRERLAREGLGPLYQFVGNDPVNRRDWLGLAVISSISVSYESGYPMNNLQVHPFWSQIFGEVDGHKPTGYVYAGYMTVYGEDGKVLLTMPVLTGGYKTIGSTVPDGGDSAVPSGSYSVETKPSGGTQGYLVSPTGDRKLIKIHYGNISAGCIVTVHGSWSEFVKHMKDTNKCKETVPLNTSKQF
jgi:RHS repeat-associated protein